MFCCFSGCYVNHPVLQEELKKSNAANDKAIEFLELLFAEPGAFGKLPSPRLFRTHLPFSLLPPTLLDVTRVAYIARDPRDIAVSFFHLQRIFKSISYKGDFKQFWKQFLNDQSKDVNILREVN